MHRIATRCRDARSAARPIALAVVATLSMLGLRTAPAATVSWLGTVDGTWSVASNWSDIVPGSTSTTDNVDTAMFDGAGNGKVGITVDLGRNIGSITFDTAAAAAYTVGSTSGATLILSSGGAIQTTAGVNNAETINAPISLQGNYTFTSAAANAAATLNFGGTIDTAMASGTTMLTLSGSNTGANTISGSISNGSGIVAITKSGPGTWVLSGSNSYSGGTSITGTLVAANPSALGAVGATVNVGSGTTSGTLVLATDSGVNAYNLKFSAGSVTHNILVDRATAGAAVNHSLGTVDFGGNSTASDIINFTKGSNVTSGTPTLTFTSVTLGGTTNNMTAMVATVGVDLSLGSVAPMTLTVATPRTATLTLDGTSAGNQITGAMTDTTGTSLHTLAIKKSNSSVWTLSGANTYTGATTISGGKLNITGSLGATAVAVNAGGTLGGSGNGTTTGIIGTGTSTAGGTVTVTGGTSAAARGAIDLTDSIISTLMIQGNATPGAFLSLGGTTAGTSSSLTFEVGTAGVDSIAVTNSGTLALNLGGATLNLVSLAGQVPAAGTYNLVSYAAGKTGTGAFSLGATPVIASSFTPYALSTTSTAGQLTVGTTVATGTTAYWNGSQSGAWNNVPSNWSMAADGATAATPPGTNTDVFFGTTSAVTNSSTTLGQDFTVKSLTFTGTGTSGATATTIAGSGLLTLQPPSGSNGVTVQAGSAAHVISSKVALGSSQIWRNNSSNAMTLGITGQTSGGSVSLGANSLTLNGTGGFTFPNTQNLSGSGTLTINTTGTVWFGTGTGGGFSNSNFSGNIILNAGTLRIDGGNSGGTSSGLLGTGVLTINGGTINGAGNISSSSLTLSGQIWNADWTYGNSKNLNMGIGPISLGTTPGTTRVVTIGTGATVLTLGGAISNGTTAIGLIKDGPGPLALTGANTYTGVTTVAAGTLTATKVSSLPSQTTSGLISVAKAATLQLNVGGTGEFDNTNLTNIFTNAALATGWNLSLDTANAAGGAFTLGSSLPTSLNTLTKLGANRLILPQDNILTKTSTVAVSVGAVELDTTSALAKPTVNLAVTNGLVFNSGVATFNLGGLSGNAALALVDNATTPAAVALQVGGNHASTTYSGVLSGAGSLVKVGAGTLTLSGANTFTGGLTIKNGTVVANVGNATNVSGAAGPSDYAVTLGDATGSNSASLLANSFTVANAINLGAASGTLSVGNNGGTTAAVYTGNVVLNGHDLTVVASGTGSTTVSGQVTGTANIIVGNLNVGTVTLAGANAGSFTGDVLLNRGLLVLKAATGTLDAGSALTVRGTSTFNFTSADNGSTQNLDVLTFNAGEGTVQSTYGTSGDTALKFSSLATRAAGATGNFIASGGSNGTTNKIAFTAAPTAGTLINRGVFFGGNSYAAYDAGGFLRAYSYSGTPDADAIVAPADLTMGTVSAASNVQTTGAISAQSTTEINTLNISNNYNFTLAANQTLTVKGLLKSGNNAATMSGGTGITTGGATELILRADQASDALTISNSILSTATGGLTKSGAGTVTLSAVNAYSGPTTVNAGALIFLSTTNTFTGDIVVNGGSSVLKIGEQGAISDACLGNAANKLSLLNGAKLQFGAVNDKAHVLLNPRRTLTISGGAKFGTPYGSADVHIPGDIVGTGGLFSQSGTLLLSGNNTFTGGITFGGTLRFSSDVNVGGSDTALNRDNVASTLGLSIVGTSLTNLSGHTFTFANSDGLSFDIQDPANTFTWDKNYSRSMNSGTNPTFVKSGPGTFLVTTPQTYDNASGLATVLNGGVMKIDYTAGGSLQNTNNRVSFGGGTLYLLGKSALATTQTFSNVKLSSGGGVLIVDNQNGSRSMTVNLGDFTTLPPLAGGSLNIQTINAGAGGAIVTSTQANDATGIVGAGRIVFNGTNWASIISGTTVGAYSGYTTVADTVTPAGTDTNNAQLTSASGTSGAVVLGGDWTTNTLKIADGVSFGLSGSTLTLTTGGLLFTGATNYAITNGTLKSATASASDLLIHQFGTGTLTIGAVIANGNGASTLTKTGMGTLVLTSANTYTGQTFVNGGVLSISANNQLNNGASTQLNLNGGALRVTDASFTTGRAVVLGGSGGTFDVANNQTFTISGVVSGGRLTLANGDGGNGTLVLSGNNTFAGGVAIDGGILKLGHNNALGALGFNTLSFGSATPAMLQINGARTIAIAALTATSTSAVIENGAAGGATLNVYNGADNTFAGTLRDGSAGTLAVGKAGQGILTLSGTNLYTGATTVLGGALSVTGSLAAGGVTVDNGATLSGTGTIGGQVNLVSGTLAPGAGVTPGVLTINNTLAFASTAGAIFDVASASSYDKIVGLTGATFAGTLTLNGVVNNTAYNLFNFATGYSGTGSFNMINVGSYTSSFDATTGVLTVGALGPTTRNWTGGDANPLDSNMGTAANWDGALAAGNAIVFGAAGTSKPNPVNETARTVGSVTFDTAGYNVGGTTKLTVTGPVTANANATISAPLELSGTGGSVVAASGATITLSGSVSGTNGLTKTGTGVVELTAASNSYTGNTAAAEGTLKISAGVDSNENWATTGDDTTVGTPAAGLDPAKVATLITEHIRQDVLTINAGSKVTISATGGASSTSVVNVLNIANSSGTFNWSSFGGGITPAATGGPVASGAAVPEPATWLLAVMAALAGLVAWRRRK